MKCEICGAKAVYRLSPDIDIKGLGACEKHKEDMMIAYTMLVSPLYGDYSVSKKEYLKYIKQCKKNDKRTTS